MGSFDPRNLGTSGAHEGTLVLRRRGTDLGAVTALQVGGKLGTVRRGQRRS